jgi:uncharacterized protein YjiS (DUF1127 family)
MGPDEPAQQRRRETTMTAWNDTPATSGLGLRLAELRSALAERLERRRIYRRTIEELSALSDRDLEDLGLHRSRIVEVAQEAAYRR